MRCTPRKLAATRHLGETRPTASQAPPAPTVAAARRAWPQTRHCGLSDCGPCRANNEDAFLADARLGLFIVCDGVGGRVSGEVAAAEAIAVIREQILGAMVPALTRHAPTGGPRTVRGEREVVVGEWPAITSIGATLRSAMQSASRAIFELGLEDPNLAGMSTTASVVLLREGSAVIGHVGDTRVYHARGQATRQVTEDHTLLAMRIQQGLLDPAGARGRKSPITRALGLRDAVEVDIQTLPLAAGDRLLLCTDGLHDYLEDDATLTRLLQMDVRHAARAAIHYASRCGGKDNATALFVEIMDHD